MNMPAWFTSNLPEIFLVVILLGALWGLKGICK